MNIVLIVLVTVLVMCAIADIRFGDGMNAKKCFLFAVVGLILLLCMNNVGGIQNIFN